MYISKTQMSKKKNQDRTPYVAWKMLLARSETSIGDTNMTR